MPPKMIVPLAGFSDSDDDNTNESVPLEALIAEELIGPKKEHVYYVYSLNSGTNIFRGSKKISANPRITGISWFAFDELNASQYGVVHKYELIHNINNSLLAVDQWDTLHWLHVNINLAALERAREENQYDRERDSNVSDKAFTPEKIQSVLKNQFGYTPDKNKMLIRSSDPKSDLLLAKYICALGFSGYAIKQMKTWGGGNFHPEVCFCLPEQHYRYIGIVSNPTNAPIKASPKTVFKSNKKPIQAYSSPDNGQTPFIDNNLSPIKSAKRPRNRGLFLNNSPMNIGTPTRRTPNRGRTPTRRGTPTRRTPTRGTPTRNSSSNNRRSNTNSPTINDISNELLFLDIGNSPTRTPPRYAPKTPSLSVKKSRPILFHSPKK